LIKKGAVVAGHDVASGGLITTLLEMCFADTNLSANLNLSALGKQDSIKVLFAENAGLLSN
jgi:phosphoribosylformylglycinamidine synthase